MSKKTPNRRSEGPWSWERSIVGDRSAIYPGSGYSRGVTAHPKLSKRQPQPLRLKIHRILTPPEPLRVLLRQRNVTTNAGMTPDVVRRPCDCYFNQ